MSNVVRAWKDAAYRQSLSAEEQAMLPENPAGGFELTDAELEAVYGASGWGGEWGGEEQSQDLCSNAKVCNLSAPAANSSENCVSVGMGAMCPERENV